MDVHIFTLVFICTHIVLIAADDNDIVPYQSFCNPSTNNAECSDNLACRCLRVIPTGERICTLQITCSSATSCNWNNKCNNTDSICVVDKRCNGRRLCYPASLTSPDTCPPLVTSNDIDNGY